MKTWTMGLAALLTATALAGPAGAQTLRIGLQEDLDTLDPTTARTYVSRIVFAGLCDKLVDYDAELNYRPQLATEWQISDDGRSVTFKLRPNVKFHDGEPMDAEAVKFSIERHQNFPESRRKSEINVVQSVEVVDPLTVRLNLSQAFSPLISQFADRAGMIVSPKAAREAGANFGQKPVCAGPFRFVERVVQDRIVLEKFADYWDAGNIHVQRVVYQPFPDTTVRLSNLQAGSLDLIERMAPSDLAAAKRDRRLKVEQITSLGYQGITVNVNNGPRADNPLGKDPRVREAFELAIDRDVINQVAFEGAYTPGNQPVPPNNPYYDKSTPIPKRDVAAAKKLLQEAGVRTPFPVELLISNSSLEAQVGQIIQAMAAEAGFDVKLMATEFASGLAMQTRGEFQAFRVGWSGRTDPDGNIHVFWHSQGSQNDSKYANPEVDRLVDTAREVSSLEDRRRLYNEANRIYQKDGAIIYLYHQNNLFAMTSKLTGFQANPDGLIRIQGIKLQ
ncbi:MAG TPA: ABC transporter substrate-binding protein [Azospirillaceae bacterium]|nr:ABC transporter substrate-binding protein [Azospirillaceae bacterium]